MKKKKDKKTVRHRLYGDIPLIQIKYKKPDGTEYIFEEFDPHYQPTLPIGAIRGHIERQCFCSHCHVPKYFYIDSIRTCIKCKNEFLFTAKEQKYWYETLHFNFYSVPIRCIPCRRKKRSENAVRTQLQKAFAIYEKRPNDPLNILTLVESICLYYQTFRSGQLSFAIGLARKAVKSWSCIEGLYWEALTQNLANRKEKARKLLEEFLQKGQSIMRFHLLCKKAVSLLEKI